MAAGPPGGQPVLELPGGLVGKGNGNDLPGAGHIHSAQPLHTRQQFLRRMGGKGFQRRQILLRGPDGDLVTVAARPYVKRLYTRWISTVVLPLPAPASSKSGPSVVMAAWRCIGLSRRRSQAMTAFRGGYVTLLKLSHNFTSFL